MSDSILLFSGLIIIGGLLLPYLLQLPMQLNSDPGSFGAVNDVHTLWEESSLSAGSAQTTAFVLGDVDRDGYVSEAVTGTSDGAISMRAYSLASAQWGGSQSIVNDAGGAVLALSLMPPDGAGNANILAIVGTSGGSEIKVFSGTGSVWTQCTIGTIEGNVSGVAVGDLSSATAGSEVVVTSSGSNIQIYTRSNGSWAVAEPEGLAVDEYNGTWGPIAIGDMDLSHHGLEAAFVRSGSNGISGIYELYASNDTYLTRHIVDVTAPVSSMMVAELDATSPGSELLVGTDAPTIVEGHGADPDGTGTATFTAVKLMNTSIDMVAMDVGDLTPSFPGPELVIANASGDCYILYGSGSTWSHQEIREPGVSLLGIGIGDTGSGNGDLGVVTCDADGGLTRLTLSPWRSTVLATDQPEKKIDGVAIGDLDPAHPGNEVVFCGLSYNVGMAWYNAATGQWNSRILATLTGECLTPVIADILPDSIHPGNELLVDGMGSGEESESGTGLLTLIYKNGNSWHSESIYTLGGMGHGMTVYDLDPAIPGNEIYTVGFDHKLNQIWLNGSTWEAKCLFTDDSKLKKIEVGDFDSEHPGAEAVFVGGDNTTEMYKNDNGSGWYFRTIYTDLPEQAPGSGCSRVAVGDADPDHPGDEVVVGTNSWKTVLVRGSGSTWENETIHIDLPSAISGNPKNRGVWVGDIDPTRPGNEVITCGYSFEAYVVWKEEGQWKDHRIWEAPGRLHEVRIGEFDPGHPGLEAVTVGYGNVLRGIEAAAMEHAYYPPSRPDLELTASVIDTGPVSAGPDRPGTALVRVSAPRGAEVTVDVSGLPATASSEALPGVFHGSSVVSISLITDGSRSGNFTLNVTLSLTGNDSRIFLNVPVTLERENVPPYVVSTDPANGAVNVLVDTTVSLTFDEPLDHTTVTSDSFMITDDHGETYLCTVEYSRGSRTVNLTDIRTQDGGHGLTRSRSVSVVVESDVTDEAGNGMSSSYSFSFRTEKAAAPDGSNWVLGIVVILLIAVFFAAAIVFFMRSKDRKAEGMGDVEATPEVSDTEQDRDEKEGTGEVRKARGRKAGKAGSDGKGGGTKSPLSGRDHGGKGPKKVGHGSKRGRKHPGRGGKGE